jgi:hypothetical protein
MLEQRLWPIDQRLALERFADLVVSALPVRGAEVELRNGSSRMAVTSGQIERAEAPDRWSISAGSGDTRIALSLIGSRRPSERDQAAVAEVLAVLARELSVA